MAPKREKPFYQEFAEHEFSASMMTKEDLEILRVQYELPQAVMISLPEPEDRPNDFKEGRFAIWPEQMRSGLKLPFSDSLITICNFFNFIPGMFQPNSYAILLGMEALFKEMKCDWDVEKLGYFLVVKGDVGFCHFAPRRSNKLTTSGLPSGIPSEWQNSWFFVEDKVSRLPYQPGVAAGNPFSGLAKGQKFKALETFLGNNRITLSLKNLENPKVIWSERPFSKSYKASQSVKSSLKSGKRKLLPYEPETSSGEEKVPLSDDSNSSNGEEMEAKRAKKKGKMEAEQSADSQPGSSRKIPATEAFLQNVKDGTICFEYPRVDSWAGEQGQEHANRLSNLLVSQDDFDFYENQSLKTLRGFFSSMQFQCLGINQYFSRLLNKLLDSSEHDLKEKRLADKKFAKMKEERDSAIKKVKELRKENDDLQLSLVKAEARQSAEASSSKPMSLQEMYAQVRESSEYVEEVDGMAREGFNLCRDFLIEKEKIIPEDCPEYYYDRLVIGKDPTMPSTPGGLDFEIEELEIESLNEFLKDSPPVNDK